MNGSSPGDDDYAYFVGMSSGANTGLAIREDNATINGSSGGDIVADKGTGSFTLNDTTAHQVVLRLIDQLLDQTRFYLRNRRGRSVDRF